MSESADRTSILAQRRKHRIGNLGLSWKLDRVRIRKLPTRRASFGAKFRTRPVPIGRRSGSLWQSPASPSQFTPIGMGGFFEDGAGPLWDSHLPTFFPCPVESYTEATRVARRSLSGSKGPWSPLAPLPAWAASSGGGRSEPSQIHLYLNKVY